MQSTHDQVRIVMSRLKLKVNNCLLNNKEFFKLFNSIFSKIGYNCFIIFQDYLNIKILKYDEIFEFWNFIYFFKFSNFQIFWNFWTLKLFFGKFWPPTDGISTLYPWNIDPPTHGISTPLPMVYWTPYPWYIDSPMHGILTPLAIEYRPPTHDILTSLHIFLL
jgi:hypothetical protein